MREWQLDGGGLSDDLHQDPLGYMTGHELIEPPLSFTFNLA